MCGYTLYTIAQFVNQHKNFNLYLGSIIFARKFQVVSYCIIIQVCTTDIKFILILALQKLFIKQSQHFIKTRKQGHGTIRGCGTKLR